MSARVEIDQYILRGRLVDGPRRLRRAAIAAFIAGVLFAGLAVLIIGLDPNQGWNRVADRWPAVALAFAFGAAIETLGSLFLEWRSLVITDAGISLRVRHRRTWHPRETVRSVSIRCWPKRHILNDALWTAVLEVHWTDREQSPLRICGAARGIERSLPALAPLYEFVECQVHPPALGDRTETEQIEKELAEIAGIFKADRHRFCFRYGALPTAAVVFIGASLLLAFQLGLAAAFAILAMPVGYFFGLVAWWALAQRARMLQQRSANRQDPAL